MAASVVRKSATDSVETNKVVKPNLEHVFYRVPQILELLPVGRSTWWAGVKSGRFPPSIKIGPRTTVWRAQDIHDLLDQLANGEDSQ